MLQLKCKRQQQQVSVGGCSQGCSHSKYQTDVQTSTSLCHKSNASSSSSCSRCG
jgi:hypothetical protein